MRDPTYGFRIAGKLFINGDPGEQAEFGIISRGLLNQLGSGVARISLPAESFVFGENWIPGQTAARADFIIDKTILAIAPGAERHGIAGIGVDDEMGPAWRDDYDVARVGLDRKTSAGIFRSVFLGVDDGATVPKFEKFRSGPSGKQYLRGYRPGRHLQLQWRPTFDLRG